MLNLNTWSLAGWVFIGIAAILLVLFQLVYKKGRGYSVRYDPAIDRLIQSRIAALEKGRHQHLGLGQALWSNLYPGLGLHGLLVLPYMQNEASLAVQNSEVTAGDGALVVLARQVLDKTYMDGFSLTLERSGRKTNLIGPTPLSYAAGLLTELGINPHESLALLGNYGPEALLFSEAIVDRLGYLFAASGNLTSQASLYASVEDVLIGENIFLLPGALHSSAKNQAGWITEDVLRILLILILIAGVVLKITGVL
jgi:hypothetical protein